MKCDNEIPNEFYDVLYSGETLWKKSESDNEIPESEKKKMGRFQIRGYFLKGHV